MSPKRYWQTLIVAELAERGKISLMSACAIDAPLELRENLQLRKGAHSNQNVNVNVSRSKSLPGCPNCPGRPGRSLPRAAFHWYQYSLVQYYAITNTSPQVHLTILISQNCVGDQQLRLRFCRVPADSEWACPRVAACSCQRSQACGSHSCWDGRLRSELFRTAPAARGDCEDGECRSHPSWLGRLMQLWCGMLALNRAAHCIV